MPTSTVKHVIFYVGLRPSGNLMLAERVDGSLCVLRDDKPLSTTWPPGQYEAAVREFLRMKEELSRAGKTTLPVQDT